MPKMIHPDVEAVASVVDETVFANVWAPRGWELLGEAEAYATEILGEPVKDASRLKGEQLKQLVAARTGKYPASSTKDEALASYLGLFGRAPAQEPAQQGTPPTGPATAPRGNISSNESAPAGPSTDKDK